MIGSVLDFNEGSLFQMVSYLHDKECSSPLIGTDAGNGENVIGNSSRPHSSTSAELETGMSAFTVQPQIVQQTVPTRTKETRFTTSLNSHPHNYSVSVVIVEANFPCQHWFIH